jgi:integrase
LRRKEPIKKVTLKNGKIRWRFVIDVGVKSDGKRDQKTFTFDTLTDARKKRAEILTDVTRGTYVMDSKKTVEQHISEWLDGRRGIKRGTANSHRMSLKPAVERIGHIPLKQLTKAHVDQLVNWMLTEGRRIGKKRGGPLSPSTVLRMLTVLRAALDDAVKQGLIVRNVAALVESPRLSRREHSTWSAEDAGAFLAHVADSRLSVAWQLSLYGLRRGEVLGVRWCDVDLVEKTLTIALERTISVGEVYEEEPKSDRSRRTLPLDDELISALRALRGRLAAERLKAGAAYAGACADCGERHLVVDELGDPIHPESYSDRFEVLVKQSGLPRIRLHDTRHTCGTLMHLRGVPIAVIAAWLGHAKADFTLRTYVHSQPEALSEAGSTLRVALSG